jgi:hypothetical protein
MWLHGLRGGKKRFTLGSSMILLLRGQRTDIRVTKGSDMKDSNRHIRVTYCGKQEVNLPS